MRVALYTRVSTDRQAHSQTIAQQLNRLREYAQQQGWALVEELIYRDEGYSGASLRRPGLDALRDQVCTLALDVVLITAPDRLARKYVHQVLLLEEWAQRGVRVVFVERPMSQDPHDQLLLQIRGAVAEYERTLISERMRRGRLAKLQSGQLLPWSRPVYGYALDPERPRDPAGVRLAPAEATVVAQIFAWYLEEGSTLYRVITRLAAAGIPAPRGAATWTRSSVRNLLRNPAYRGTTYANRVAVRPPRTRRSALLPVGPGHSTTERPTAEWLPIPVPPMVSAEVFALAQEKLTQNQQRAARHNTRHAYLLRNLVSCGLCHLAASALSRAGGYAYYICTGHTGRRQPGATQQCVARFLPAAQLDALVWTDLCQVLRDPALISAALERAQHGAWLPQEMQARRTTLAAAAATLERQDARLLEAYLQGVLDLPTFDRKRRDLAQRQEIVQQQQAEVDALMHQRIEASRLATSIEEFAARVRQSLATVTFAQKRTLVELLIDRVVVTNDEVEIRYVLPTTPEGTRHPFCHLRLDYRADQTGDIGIPTPIDSNRSPYIIATAAEVGAIEYSRPCRIELGDEDIVSTTAGCLHGGGDRKVGRSRFPGCVGVPAAVHGHSIADIIATAAQIAAIT